MELVFVAIDLMGDFPRPILEQDHQARFRLATKLPEREAGEPFEDTERDFATQSVILPRGAYLLAEIGFVNSKAQSRQSWCLDRGSFAFDVAGADTMFMGLMDIAYPDEAAGNDFNPARKMLDSLSSLNGWRWTLRDLQHLQVRPITFPRSEAFCKVDSRSAAP